MSLDGNRFSLGLYTRLTEDVTVPLYYGSKDPSHSDINCDRVMLRVECPECSYPACESQYLLRDGNPSLPISLLRDGNPSLNQHEPAYAGHAALVDCITGEPLVVGEDYQDAYGNTLVLTGITPPMFAGDTGRVMLRGEGDGTGEAGYSPSILDAKFTGGELPLEDEADDAALWLAIHGYEVAA